MLFLTVLAGVIIWGILDYFQSKELKSILYAQQSERLRKEAQDARVHFDNYVASYNKAARLLISQKQFHAYLEKKEWFSGSASSVKYYEEIPPWLPDASVLRMFAHIHYALLIDNSKKVREIYQGWPGPPPRSLSRPDDLLQKLSSGQSFLTNLDGAPFVLTAEAIADPGGRKVTLMFASPLNDDFLISSLEGTDRTNITALVDRQASAIIATSSPAKLPVGTRLASVKERYLITGKSFFDYGASDLMLQLTSLISRDEYEMLGAAILAKERRHYAFSALVYIMAIALIMLWITRQVGRLAQDITDFSFKELGVLSKNAFRGDELVMLMDRFYRLAGEVSSSRSALVEEKNNLKKAHEELESAYSELKAAQSQMLQREKMASIGQLAAGVAHEINNPMGFIISNLGTLGKYTEKLREFIWILEEGIKECQSVKVSEDQDLKIANSRRSLKIDYIHDDIGSLIKESLDGAQRVRKIVQNLKTFSRLDEAEYQMVDMNEELERVINILWNELKYKATLKRGYGDIPKTECNPGQLGQVFMNLLVNAADAIEEHGEITVKTWHEAGNIHVSISDTGSGIPEDKLGRIFEPFFTTKEVGKGTGLGLSIAYDIIKKHKGEITVKSDVAKGTLFTIRIPVVEARGENSG